MNSCYPTNVLNVFQTYPDLFRVNTPSFWVDIHMSIHMHTREYAYYTCIISYSVKTEARPIANTRPAGSCNIFPLGIWNFGSDLQDGWQIEKLFGALSFSNLTRVSAFSLTPLPGIQASWILFNRFCNIKS